MLLVYTGVAFDRSIREKSENEERTNMRIAQSASPPALFTRRGGIRRGLCYDIHQGRGRLKGYYSN
ncbi:MAG: hypothetical protein ACREWE_04660, partial [Gammaproteobacteria bacterium]